MHLNFVQHTQNNRLITYITEPYILLNIFVSLHIRSKYDNTIPGFNILVALITFQSTSYKGNTYPQFWCRHGFVFWGVLLWLVLLLMLTVLFVSVNALIVCRGRLCNCLFSFLHSCMMQTKEIVTLCLSFVHYYGIFILIFCFELI